MPSANSLLSTCIAQFYPDQMLKIIEIAEQNGYDFSFIHLDINKYNTFTLKEMEDFSKEYAPWWGLPHRIEAHTTNKSLMDEYYKK